MRLFNRKMRVFTRIIAGVSAICVTVPAVFIYGGELSRVPGAVNAAIDYIRTPAVESVSVSVTPINNGSLMLYTPVKDNAEKKPIVIEEEPHFFEEETEPVVPPQVALPVISRNISLEREDLTRFTSKSGTVTRMTFTPALSSSNIHLTGGGQIRNKTSIEASKLLKESELPLKWTPHGKDEPTVLIYHTHTTESFRLSAGEYYDPKYIFRTVDSDNNIVAVGAKIAEEIAKMGFSVIHDGTLHDYPVFRGAYGRSASTVREILREYPSIQVVFDVHRDGIESGGMPVAAIADIKGKEAAQVMIVAPADNGEWDVPNFMENFRFAARLQGQMENDSPGLTRAILFQYCNYNLHLSPAALLIEIGSHGNTLEQALYAGELFGQSVGRLLTELSL